MKLAMSKTREQFPLSPKKVFKKTVPALISSIFFNIALLIALLFVKWFVNASIINKLPAKWVSIINGPSLIIYLMILSVIYSLASVFMRYQFQKWYFQVYFYDLTDDFIIIRKRVFSPTEITIPYERIQDVYSDQDMLDRLFGLYDIHLSSATVSSGIEAHIDGLEKDSADGLKKAILEKINFKNKQMKGGTS